MNKLIAVSVPEDWLDKIDRKCGASRANWIRELIRDAAGIVDDSKISEQDIEDMRRACAGRDWISLALAKSRTGNRLSTEKIGKALAKIGWRRGKRNEWTHEGVYVPPGF